MGRVTLKDVAVHAGVSHQTVSNVLNNHPSIRPLTRERVLQSVSALEYQPNQAAKALREARTTTLCCAFAGHNADELGDPYRNLIQAAFVAEARQQGYSMTIAFIDLNDEASLLSLRRGYQQRLFGGVVIVCTQLQAQTLAFLRQRGMKLVVFDAGQVDASVSTIDADYAGGMRLLVEHYHRQGRRHLALIIPTNDPGYSTQTRLNSFVQATAEYKLQAEIIGGDWSAASGERAMHQLWQQPHHPDAVLAANDRMAAGALRAAHHLQLDIPGEVAISGFDDLDLAQYTHPSLTTVRVPFADMARQAVRQLLNQDIQTLTFPTELIVRESA